MGKVRSVKGCQAVRQFTRAVRSQSGHVESGGRHVKLCYPGGGKVPMPSHGGKDINRNTARGMSKMLLILGFTCIPFICVVIWLIGVL